MNNTIPTKKAAILVGDGFEQVELEKPKQVLEGAGVDHRIFPLEKSEVQGFNHAEKRHAFHVDLTLDEAEAAKFDALVLPGGVHNPGTLSTNRKALFLPVAASHRQPRWYIFCYIRTQT